MKITHTSFLFLILVLLFPTMVLSQSRTIDSLKKELSMHTQRDTTRVDLLNSLAYNYRRNNISRAEEKSIEANNLAKELGYAEGLAKSILIFSKIHISKSEFNEAREDALNSLTLYKKFNSANHKGILSTYSTLGMISGYQNDPDTAVEYFKKSLQLAKEHGDRRSEGDALGNIGVTYYSKGDLENASKFYKKSITVYEEIGNPKRGLTSLNNIAVISTIQGRYLEALENYNKSLILQREDNEKDDIATTLHNMGIVYSEMEQYTKALTYFEEALQINKELESKLKIAISLNSIGGTYVDLKKHKKGLEYLNEALILNKEINNEKSLVACHNAIGDVQIILNEPRLALSHFKTSLALSVSAGDKRNIGISHISLAEVYFRLKDYPTAMQHALEGKQIVDKLEMLAEQKEVNHTLSKIYEATRNFKKALSSHQLYKSLNDSLFNKENIEKMTQLEYEYKYKQRLDSASIRELKLTKTVKDTSQDLQKSKRNYLWAIIVFLLVSILLGGIIFYLKFRNIKSETQNIVIEQKLLRSQMTPHFIFNSLSVLQGMILNKEEEKSVTYLSKFSKLLRIILENSRDKMVLLSQELAAVENYLALQNLENQSYGYTISVEKNIEVPLFKIPPMLIQPFVENAIEHAFGNQTDTRQINVHLNYIDKKLVCTITDNGIGIDSQNTAKRKDKTSLATTITSERLKILSKGFKIEGSVTIEDRQIYREQGTVVTLIIPYKMNCVKVA